MRLFIWGKRMDIDAQINASVKVKVGVPDSILNESEEKSVELVNERYEDFLKREICKADFDIELDFGFEDETVYW